MAPVSVVIPCFNCSKTLERALASVHAQTVRPTEVILVDDASTDSSRETARRLQQQHEKSWIRLITLEENGGPATARNAAWNAATQPYLAFLDADDSWHPRKLEIQWKFMNARPDVHISAHGYFEPGVNSDNSTVIMPEDYKIIDRSKLLLANRLATRTVMLKSALDYRFSPGKRYAEDYLLWLQMACDGKTIVLLDAELAYAYKAAYGDSGLSGRLWLMERGELATYWQLNREGRLSTVATLLLTLWSLTKYLRRLLRVSLRATNDVAKSQ